MASSSSSKKRSRTPDGHDRHVKKGTKDVSDASKSKRKPATESDETDSSSESDSDRGIKISLKAYRIAGRTIARCYDMFCDVGRVITVILASKQADAAENGDPSDSDDEAVKQSRNEVLRDIFDKTLARYKRVYAALLRLVPSIKLLIDDPLLSEKLKKVTNDINSAMSEARSNDMTGLREKIVGYAAPNPTIPILPTIPPGSSRSVMGINHPVLAGYLCPVHSVKKFHEDTEETRKKLESGKIKTKSSAFPALLWEDIGRNYNKNNMFQGFFRGFYIERIIRHIFKGPSTGFGGEARGSKPSNSDLHHMDRVSAAQLAYVAVHARFGISSKTRWAENDGVFSYRKYYYALLDMIDDCEDAKWKEGILKHYNVILFNDEKGRQNDSDFDDDDDDEDDDSSTKGGFLSAMRAQAAARASSSRSPDENADAGPINDFGAINDSDTIMRPSSPLPTSDPPVGVSTATSLQVAALPSPAVIPQASIAIPQASVAVPSASASTAVPPASTAIPPPPTAIPQLPAAVSQASTAVPQTSAAVPQAPPPAVTPPRIQNGGPHQPPTSRLVQNHPTSQTHLTSRAPVQGSPSRQTREQSPMSELSDLDKEAKAKKTAVKKGKRKAIVLSDEEREAESSRPRPKRPRKERK